MNTEEDTPAAEAPEAASVAPEAARQAKRESMLPPPSSLQEIVGALLFASETPLSAADLRECVRSVHPAEDEASDVMSVYESCTSREIENALHGLEKELERCGAGFRLVNAGGTYRLQTAPPCGRYVRALLHLDRPTRLSRASLETLAIIAYRQPISKAEVEQIRGVSVDTMVKTLMDLQLVRLVGRSELPGHPYLYGTTPLFLEHFGLSSLQQLNELDPTLQRDDPKERARKYEKKPPAEPAGAQLPGLDANGDVAIPSPAAPAEGGADGASAGTAPAGADAEDAPPDDGGAAPEADDAGTEERPPERPIFLMPPVGDGPDEDDAEDDEEEVEEEDAT